jgi:hypothetical protein
MCDYKDISAELRSEPRDLLIFVYFHITSVATRVWSWKYLWWMCGNPASRKRVARWYIFKPKIPIWINFGGSYNWRCWYILWPLGLFYGRLVFLCHLWWFVTYFSHFGMLYREKSGNPTEMPLQLAIHLNGFWLTNYICASAFTRSALDRILSRNKKS